MNARAYRVPFWRDLLAILHRCGARPGTKSVIGGLAYPAWTERIVFPGISDMDYIRFPLVLLSEPRDAS